MNTRSTIPRTAVLLLLLSLATACRDELPTAPLAIGPPIVATDVAAGEPLTADEEVAPTARPAAPTNLSVQAVVAGRLDLSWTDASADETSFRVQRSRRAADGSFPQFQIIATLPAGAVAYIDWAVSSGATYRYRVQACNASGCTSSVQMTMTVPQRPSPPVNLTATPLAGPQVQLTWTLVSGNGRVRVERGTRLPDGGYGPFQVIATLPSWRNSYADSTVQVGQVYRYRVSVCNVAGCGYSNGAIVTIPPPPGKPTQFVAQAVSATRVDLSWTDASNNENAFRVRRSTRQPDGTFAPYDLVGTLAANTTQFSDFTVTGGNTYRYAVQACRNTTCTSSISVYVTVPGP